MRLLIVTQKVDRADSVLGFFHRWLEEFAKHCDELVVIAQLRGDYDLPANVTVLTLGKEDGSPRWLQVLRFWKILLSRHGSVDSALVHMTPLWVVLGAPLWFLRGTGVFLWYEVRRGGWTLSMATALARKVFCATKDGLPWASKKQRVLGHGIDVEGFSAGTTPRDTQLLASAGRITPFKRYDVILRAFAGLPGTMRLVLAGTTIVPKDNDELARLQNLTRELRVADRVRIAPLRHREVRDLLRSASFMLHACDGGLDKIVLEAMACECPVLTVSRAAAPFLPPECQATIDTFAEKTRALVALPVERRKALGAALRRTVLEHHNLHILIDRMMWEMAVR